MARLLPLYTKYIYYKTRSQLLDRLKHELALEKLKTANVLASKLSPFAIRNSLSQQFQTALAGKSGREKENLFKEKAEKLAELRQELKAKERYENTAQYEGLQALIREEILEAKKETYTKKLRDPAFEQHLRDEESKLESFSAEKTLEALKTNRSEAEVMASFRLKEIYEASREKAFAECIAELKKEEVEFTEKDEEALTKFIGKEKRTRIKHGKREYEYKKCLQLILRVQEYNKREISFVKIHVVRKGYEIQKLIKKFMKAVKEQEKTTMRSSKGKEYREIRNRINRLFTKLAKKPVAAHVKEHLFSFLLVLITNSFFGFKYLDGKQEATEKLVLNLQSG